MKNLYKFIFCALLSLIFATYGCGGSSGGGGTTTTTPPGAVSITITPANASLGSVRVQSFTATVSGSSNTGVTWTSSGGAITPDGIFIATTAGSFTVTAASQADPTKSVTATVTVSPIYPRFLYSSNNTDNSLSAFTVNSATGQLRADGYASSQGANPASVAVDPAGKYVYVANHGNNSIGEFAVTSSGSLSMIGTSNTNLSSPISIDIEPNGKYLYVLNTNSNPNTVSSYGIGSASGQLTYIGSSNIGSGTGSPAALTVDPSGRFVYVVDNVNYKIFAFKIGNNGALSSIGTTNTGPGPNSVSVDPLDRFVYVTNNNSNTVSAYTIGSTGALNAVSSVINTGNAPNSVTVDPTGQFAYVVNNSDKAVQAYSITSSGSFSSIGTTVSTGVNPLSIKVDPTGKFAYVANSGANSVVVYSISNGLLTYASTMRTQNAPSSLVISRGSAPVSYIPQYAFVANYASRDVYGYSISSNDGSLAPNGSPVTISGDVPYSIAVDPTGQYAYVVGYNSSHIFQYTISNGILNPQSTASVPSGGAQPVSIAIDPSGKYVFVVNRGTPSVSVFGIDNNGSLFYIASYATGSGPSSVAVDPTGKFVLVANQNDSTVSSYTFSQGSQGSLTPNLSNPFPVSLGTGDYPNYVIIDPSGRYAYVANLQNGSSISMFKIALDGSLTLNGAGTITGVYSPMSIAVAPSGKYLYVANQSSTANSISAFSIDSTGILNNNISGSPYTDSRMAAPTGISIDPSGAYLFTANYGNPGNASVAGGLLDPNTGVLSNLTVYPYQSANTLAQPQAIVTSGMIQ